MFSSTRFWMKQLESSIQKFHVITLALYLETFLYNSEFGIINHVVIRLLNVNLLIHRQLL